MKLSIEQDGKDAIKFRDAESGLSGRCRLVYFCNTKKGIEGLETEFSDISSLHINDRLRDAIRHHLPHQWSSRFATDEEMLEDLTDAGAQYMSHSQSQIIEHAQRGENIWILKTRDVVDTLVGDKDQVVEDIKTHFELSDFPHDWILTQVRFTVPPFLHKNARKGHPSYEGSQIK
jgi:hypothetical protein